jgi:hypothetical protein
MASTRATGTKNTTSTGIIIERAVQRLGAAIGGAIERYQTNGMSFFVRVWYSG